MSPGVVPRAASVPIALALALVAVSSPVAAQAAQEPQGGPAGKVAPRPVVLWHSWRGAEEKALDELIDGFNASQGELRVEVLAIPNEVFASKIDTAVPHGNGPDLFAFAHDRVGGWARTGVVAPLDGTLPPDLLQELQAPALQAMRFDGKLWGLPLAVKSVALFYDPEKIAQPPRTTDELLETAARHSGDGRFGLVYLTGLFYLHAPWFFGYGGELFRADGTVGFDSPGSVAALGFVAELQRRKVVPEEVSGALVAQLYNDRRAAMVIAGPWFTGEIAAGRPFKVAPLPTISATGRPASPFLTAEGVMISARARSFPDALRVARLLAEREGAVHRGVVGRQVVANRRAWEDPRLASDPVLVAFRDQAALATPTDNRPEMRNVWEPGDLMLRKVLRAGASPEQAAKAAARRHRAITRPSPPKASPSAYVALVVALALGGLALFVRWVLGVKRRGETKAAAAGLLWVAPAMGATAILIFLPFAVGLVLSFFDHREGNWSFVGFANFLEILASRSYGPTEPLSFYYALAVTVLWTAANLSLHVGLGLFLALLLDRPALRLRGIYRVLLIVPWAVPNYITALIWKGLFHKQFGAINGLLEWLGIGGVAWFSQFWTAFFANLCANAWLGFPFMMVVSLGALQSIPKDLYEAAEVDGASAWDRFRHITLPLLRPALIPAVLLGTVWTFNQFNVVYLVSGGEPDNATDILISEAYRWAFTRQDQYGYAAAYAAIIFVLLLGWSAISGRISRAAEAM